MIEIIYEDKNLTVCIKPVGYSSEDSEIAPCVPALLREHWHKPDAYVGVVHRLDMGASGLMVYARNKAAAAALSRQVAEGNFHKEYLCVCAGTPEPALGTMEDWLFKDSHQHKVFPVKKARKGAKKALLDYEVLESNEESALCRVQLHTGRTHQIRVQFASRKHPLYGDGKYGSRVKSALGLWSARLEFTLPGETEPRIFYQEPPAVGAFAPFFAAE